VQFYLLYPLGIGCNASLCSLCACRISGVFICSLLFGLSASFVHHVLATRSSIVFIGSLLFGLSAAFVHRVPACRTSIVFIGSLLFGLVAKVTRRSLGDLV